MIVGAQLYTLREWMTTEQQVVDTLQKVSDLGFTHVQLSGMSAPVSPERLRAIADEYGLHIVLTHTDPQRILNDTPGVIRDHEIMGCTHVGIAPAHTRKPPMIIGG